MMCRMTAVAQGDQIRWLIAAAGRTWKEMMNISFISIAQLLAFDALELVTSKYGLSNGTPIPFNCACQVNLALSTIRYQPSCPSPAEQLHHLSAVNPSPSVALHFRQ